MVRRFGFCLLAFFLLLPLWFWPTLVLADEWYQEAHDAQRTGYTPEEPAGSWTFAWGWNGAGGTSHFFDAGSTATHGGSSVNWEGRTVTGGDFVFAPAYSSGLYALRKSNGSVAWSFNPGTTFKATPAYDPGTNCVFIGGSNGILYKINAQNGIQVGSYQAGDALDKAVLLAGEAVYVVTNGGALHKVNTSNLARAWVYQGNASVGTAPAYSATRRTIIYGTRDLWVHAVNENDGSQKWRKKPSSNSPGGEERFDAYWPVVAEQTGIVLLRVRLDFQALNGPVSGHFPNSNQETRSWLEVNPSRKNLFALNLDSGNEAFTPAVGYCGVEGFSGSSTSETGPVPVVKTVDGKEVAYEVFRNGQNNPDGFTRDAHMGEMVLDGSTIPGMAAGDLRFISWCALRLDSTGFHLADAVCPVSMAGNTLFHSGWGSASSATITNRSSSLGLTYSNPIQTQKRPTVVRRLGGSPGPGYTASGDTLPLYIDGSPYCGPGFGVYWNQMDPPTPSYDPGSGGAYSEGIQPRYTYVADGLVIFQGNGGELFVLRHSGSPPPPVTPTPSGATPSPPPPTPTSIYKPGDLNRDGRVDIADLVIVGSNFGRTTSQGDVNGDGMVNINDLVIVGSNFGR